MISSVLTIVILILSYVQLAHAQEIKGITMGYPSLAFTQSHIWVGKEQGVFRKYGLEVHPIFLRGGQVATQAPAAGQDRQAGAILRSGFDE